ncbi:hypothetical protein [Lawsonibacter faecis]|uniref:NodB homology domain-containing protein n=1 Tax=Lawsonibacter faecis TaxID=2763052 RepID=A0A8J6MGT4_9FIRM|nr:MULTISPECIES: hypothetical protein [Oscillospiraceae]MBC5737403.1 hypothetical protein [Lawsonibacter faecis]
MNWKKALVCLLCSAVVLFSVNLPGAYAAGSDTIIFLALNDNLVTSPSVENMPIAVGGTVYVPYTMFDANITGNSLGVIVGAVNNVVTVFNKQKVLTYDLNANTCYDRNGNSYTRAIMRNGIIYLPLVSLCNYFGREVINNYQRDMGGYYAVRIYTPDVVLEDDQFMDAASSTLNGYYKSYLKSIAPSPSPSPSSSPTPSLTPSSSPSPAPSPSPGPDDNPDKRDVRVYLSVQCGGEEGLTDILELLERSGTPALFFFRVEELRANDDVIRRLLASGYTVGLTIPGGPAEDAKAQLEEGNRLLELIAHTSTRTVRLESGESAVAEALESEGWALWTPNAAAAGSGSAAAYANALLQSIDARKAAARVTLDDSPRTAAALPRVLNGLREQNYQIRLAVETEIG